MQIQYRKIIAFTAFGAIIFSAGFISGARVGVREFSYADAQYKASILAGTIKVLKAGRALQLIPAMEIDLNAEIAKHGKYMESHIKWLFPELRSKDDRPIKQAVAYRLANPFEGPDLSKKESWNSDVKMDDPFVLSTIEGQKEGQVYLKKVLSAYGNVANNTSLQLAH